MADPKEPAKNRPPGSAEPQSGGSKDASEGKSNTGAPAADDKPVGGKSKTQAEEESEESDPTVEDLDLDKKNVKAAHDVIKETEKELKEMKGDDSRKSRVGGRRMRSTGGFFGSVNGFLHNTLEKIAAAAHVVFTKENIPTLRAIIVAFPGESALESFLLLALDQYEKNLADNSADLTAEALNR